MVELPQDMDRQSSETVAEIEGQEGIPFLPIIGVGASAGGLEALREMLGAAKVPTGMAFVVVQHLDPYHESMLAQLLDRHTPLTVVQSEGGERLQAETVYIIPPGHGLIVSDGVLELTEFAQPRGLRRPIDDFFVSLAGDQQTRAACVILSGTGGDGTTGLRAVKEHGGLCVVQDPSTAKYDGMPVSAVGTGLVDFIKAPGEILACLSSFFRRRESEATETEAGFSADLVDDLTRVLRTTVGHDFSGYKRSTLVRRVERRMHVLGLDTGRSYVARLRADGAECEALFRDLLINVTRFLRDAEHFKVLREKAIEPLMREHTGEEDLRVWVPGCSSGEEAYSIAMIFAEVARETGQPLGVQIFATDIDERMLRIARDGIYPASALADIPADWRERYLVPHAESFAINPAIRDLIRFSPHSLVKDPPFSRIDLLSCRNLLIYFDDRLQQSVIPLMHYAVRPGGYLFLGPSESVSRFEYLFPTIDHQARLFERSPGAPQYPIDLPGSGARRPVRHADAGGRRLASSESDEMALLRRIVDRYAPATLVLDQDGNIAAAHGPLSRFFDFPVSRAGGSSATSLAKPGLRSVVGPLLRQVRDNGKRLVVNAVEVKSEYGAQEVQVVCDPMPDGTFLFVFRETAPFRPASDPDLVAMSDGDDHLETLEHELRATRHRLRSAVEELETANEELKSSNEEMMSMNEELQSTNEELSTVNDELKGKVDQITVANSDLRNFFESTELAVVVLDRNLCLRSFTAAALKLFPFQPSDRGRPLADMTSRLDDDAYLGDAEAVLQGHAPMQRRVTLRKADRTLALRIMPYRTQTDSVDGVTLVFTDITDALSLERELTAERERLDLAVKAGGIGIWEYLPDSGQVILDPTERDLFGADDAETHRIENLLATIEPEDRERIEEELGRAASGEADFEASFRIATQGGETRYLKGFGRLVADSVPRRLVGVSIDVTTEREATNTREIMLREMNHRVKNLFAIIGGMITAGSRTHSDVRAFSRGMRERIAALGRAHSLAAPSGEQYAIDLGELLHTTLAAYRGQAEIEIDGPSATIDGRYLSPLALLLHEWATNSYKYGALGADNGRLRVSWAMRDDGLDFSWLERSDRTKADDGEPGFGTLLVETSSRQLDTQIRREVGDGRFQIEMRLPAEVLARV
ncbi:CheR family methyltransferase [uncultured Aureimonas sp.]|uniref:CheR family methyltransferase n=1 Tax=uncultured Aureimonas sp. TaxID=1604662 RepID=UPI0025E31276|nr:CheR family methyltransferase [uncultured Aureimonas sp.]